MLIGTPFYYFGRNAVTLPTPLAGIATVGRGYKNRFESELVDASVHWLSGTFSPGLLA